MLRQSSSRNQRSKGRKVKYGLRICLLLALCFWLIYQVKHSHENAKQFDDDEANDSLDGGLIKLGRKDIHSQVTRYDEHHHEEEDRSETKDENEGEDDELDKLDAGVDMEEDIVVDDEQREDDAVNENEEKHMDDGILQSWSKENKSEGSSKFDKRENLEESSDGGITNKTFAEIPRDIHEGDAEVAEEDDTQGDDTKHATEKSYTPHPKVSYASNGNGRDEETMESARIHSSEA